MPAILRLTLDRDTDGTGALNAEARSGAFAGRGQAWFDIQRIADFGRALDAYPIPDDGQPTLQGGYWHNDGSGIKQEHVFVSVAPVGKRGTLAVHVRLARASADLSASSDRIELVLLANYGSIQRFAQDVQRLAKNEVKEAVLEADEAR